MTAPKPGQQIVAIILHGGNQTVANVRSFATIESGTFGYYGAIDEEISPEKRRTRYVHGRLRLDEEGTVWVRGWDSPEARALCVMHGITR